METISIGVPVYRGKAFVAETLASIAAQTHREIDVLISVDGSDDDSVAACEPFLRDSRFRLVVQPERLGWVANINYLMSERRGQFWYYHQQDDLVAPDYIQHLLRAARVRADAAVLYCDIETFGERSGPVVQPSVVGDPAARMLILLHRHLAAVAFRGLVRGEALCPVRGNERGDYRADTVWMISAARSGNLVRVPGQLYRKRYHADNIHTGWGGRPPEEQEAGWIAHCRDMVVEALLVGAVPSESRLLWGAGLTRLISYRLGRPRWPRGREAEGGPSLLSRYLAAFGDRRAAVVSALKLDWSEIELWSSLQLRKII